MKTIIMTIVFSFGGDQRATSWIAESMDKCYSDSETLLQTDNIQQVICSELRAVK